MRAAMPFLLILLALFSAGCIAYFAWELTSEKQPDGAPDED
jgi:threonine/homoserine/homoserine lactone efflux protein